MSNCQTKLPENSTAIAYSGTIRTQIKKGNQLLASQTYHNAGLPAFFSGLSRVLVGTSSAADIMPMYIVLYKSRSSAASTEDLGWEVLAGDLNTAPLERASNPCLISQRFIRETDRGYSAVFQATIPYSLIDSDTIQAIALFPKQATQNSNALAYHYLSNAIKLSRANSSYDLLIEWQLDFTNSTEGRS
jgi:hypothetical protein